MRIYVKIHKKDAGHEYGLFGSCREFHDPQRTIFLLLKIFSLPACSIFDEQNETKCKTFSGKFIFALFRSFVLPTTNFSFRFAGSFRLPQILRFVS